MSEQLQAQILDAVQELATASQAFGDICRELAQAEHAYRQMRATEYLAASTGSDKRTVDHLKAMVDVKCDRQMLRTRLAEADKEAAIQRIYSLRTQISAAQSVLAKEREEARAVSYGQGAGA